MSKVVKTNTLKRIEISEEEKAQYKEAFDMFDIDKSGKISCEEIHKIMKNMGNEMTIEHIKEMISDLDDDASGEIDFDEFITFMQRTQTQEEITEEEEVIRAFKTFDKDNNGWLSCAEFKHILCNLGDKFSDEEVNEIFAEADLNNDGRIEYREFVEFWRNK